MNYLFIASDALNRGAIYAAAGFTGAAIHGYLGTRYATPLLTGVVSASAAGISSVAIKHFFYRVFPQVSMPKTTIVLLSLYIGSLAATQVGLPIEIEQCVIQIVSGGAAGGIAIGFVRAAVADAVRARDFLRARGLI